jgi:hypothetical protein
LRRNGDGRLEMNVGGKGVVRKKSSRFRPGYGEGGSHNPDKTSGRRQRTTLLNFVEPLDAEPP